MIPALGYYSGLLFLAMPLCAEAKTIKSGLMPHAYHDCAVLWKNLLLAGLADDHWQLDWTTLGALALGTGTRPLMKPVRARIVAKTDGVWAADGLGDALRAVSGECGMPIRVETRVRNGIAYRKGAELVRWTGPARMVLAAERPFLNLASYCGGIATTTRRLSDTVNDAWKKLGLAVKGHSKPRITATRKTLPQYRDLAVHAVLCGGGHSHRVNLSGGVLIKENHIAAAGGIAKAVHGCRDAAPHPLKIECEVRNPRELREALSVGADGVLLDNFLPAEVRSAVAVIRQLKPETFVEVSGGIRETTIADYVIPGVQVLSVGALTHSVESVDLSLLVGLSVR